MKKRQRWQGFSLAGCAVWLVACVCAVFLSSCLLQPSESVSVYASVPQEPVSDDTPKVNDWTFIVYMAADNNLESAAIADFNELEAVAFPDDVQVLVLFDRVIGNDATNGDWTDTRLFRVIHDETDSNAIILERLDCSELGLSATDETELDMANKHVLASLLAYAGRAFPATHYGLIVWGHGTGWRGEAGSDGIPAKAFAVDNTTMTYMSISELREGIEAGLSYLSLPALDVIGFDTCFGICLETAYELRACAQLLMGTPALVPANGWDYTQLFSLFFASEKTSFSFAQCALTQFSVQYAQYDYASFSVVDCAQVAAVADAFNTFSGEMASIITDITTRNAVNAVLQETCVRYSADTFPTDCYLDVQSFAQQLGTAYTPVAASAQTVLAAVQAAVPVHWSKTMQDASCGMGVFYIAYQSQGIPAYSHDSLYVHNSRTAGQCQFVLDCAQYVPTASCTGSLLDALFYQVF